MRQAILKTLDSRVWWWLFLALTALWVLPGLIFFVIGEVYAAGAGQIGAYWIGVLIYPLGVYLVARVAAWLVYLTLR